jgi:hypothetical protein
MAVTKLLKVILGRGGKFDPVARGCETVAFQRRFRHSRLVSCGDGTVDLEMAERPLDAVTLTVKPLVVADRFGAVRSSG